MTILITGAAGFIGSNFVHEWRKDSDEPIIVLDKLTYAGNKYNIEDLDGCTLIQGDICDRSLIDYLFSTHRITQLINFAAESHVDRSISGPAEFVRTNINGTFTLLEAVRTSKKLSSDFKFLHVSTDEVYGSLGPNDEPFTELHQYKPNSPYSASKAASDHLVRSYFHTYGLPVLTTNCSNNYGPYHYPEKLIPLVILNALEGKPLPIYGNGQQVRDWLYVTDHCSAIRRVLKAGRLGETYNIGGNNEKTNLEVVNTLCYILDELSARSDGKSYKEQVTFVADRPGHDQRYAINARKLETELGWKPKETFETGIRKTVQWYLDNQEWVQQVKLRMASH